MLQPISRNKLLTTLEWLLFFILCTVAMVFCWPMLEEYESKQTSLSQSKEDILERPTITICFDARKFEHFGDEGAAIDTCSSSSNR